MRSALIPIITTLAGVALEVGNYENPSLANWLWGGCALLWLLWAYLHIPRIQSLERKRFEAALVQHRTIGEFIAEGETILIRLKHAHKVYDRPFWWREDYSATDDIDRWVRRCQKFLRATYSDICADDFYKLGVTSSVEKNPTYIQALDNRLAHLKNIQGRLFGP